MPDWQSIISDLQDFEETSLWQSSDDEALHRRLKRFSEKNGPGEPEATRRLRDGVLEIALEFQLSLPAAARLFISLSDLEGCHRISKEWDALPKKSATARRLDDIEKSIGRISNFPRNGDVGNDEAIRFLIREGNRWAQKQDPERLQELGFVRFRGKTAQYEFEAVDFGASEVIRRWFQLAPIIQDFVHQAKLRLNEPERETEWFAEDDSGYTVPRLLGHHLPLLYERTTGKKFAVSRSHPRASDAYDAKASVRDKGGVRFARMAMEAMGHDQPSPETVARYWTSKGKST